MTKFVLKLLRIIHRAKKAIKSHEKDGCFTPGNPPIEKNNVILIRHQSFATSDCVEIIPRIVAPKILEDQQSKVVRRQSTAADLDWRLNNFGNTWNLPRIDSFKFSSASNLDDAEDEKYSTLLSEFPQFSWHHHSRLVRITSTMDFSGHSTLQLRDSTSMASSLVPERITCRLQRYDDFDDGISCDESFDASDSRNRLSFLASC